ncbi:hypothetical protein V8C44DRAFT_350456 [Trichoderma aethiopicum]
MGDGGHRATAASQPAMLKGLKGRYGSPHPPSWPGRALMESGQRSHEASSGSGFLRDPCPLSSSNCSSETSLARTGNLPENEKLSLTSAPPDVMDRPALVQQECVKAATPPFPPQPLPRAPKSCVTRQLPPRRRREVDSLACYTAHSVLRGAIAHVAGVTRRLLSQEGVASEVVRCLALPCLACHAMPCHAHEMSRDSAARPVWIVSASLRRANMPGTMAEMDIASALQPASFAGDPIQAARQRLTQLRGCEHTSTYPRQHLFRSIIQASHRGVLGSL